MNPLPTMRALIERSYPRPAWRRARAIMLAIQASSRPGLYPRSPVVEAYWWDGHPNFGDALTPWLLLRKGIIPVHTEVADSEMVGVGSLVQFIPDDYSGLIWGTGLISDEQHDIVGATVLGLRGPRTRAALGVNSNVALGDPGLLVSTVVPRPRPRHELGIVPHGSHFIHPAVTEFVRRNPDRVKLIDVARPVGPVIRDIASCRAIVSTSLHGVIVADSFGIPAAWTTLEPALIGGEFKFLDHESVVTGDEQSRRIDFTPEMSPDSLKARTHRADPVRLATAIEGLERSVDLLRAQLSAHDRSPLAVWNVLVARKTRRARPSPSMPRQGSTP